MCGVCAAVGHVAANAMWLQKEDAQVRKVSAGRQRQKETERNSFFFWHIWAWV